MAEKTMKAVATEEKAAENPVKEGPIFFKRSQLVKGKQYFDVLSNRPVIVTEVRKKHGNTESKVEFLYMNPVTGTYMTAEPVDNQLYRMG